MKRSLPVLAILVCVGGAHASDLSAAPDIGASIGADTGWYGRIDAAHTLADDADRLDGFVDGTSLTGFLDGGTALMGGVGIGYKFTDIWRADVTARYGSDDVNGGADAAALCGAGCSLEALARRETVDLDFNLYADLGTIMGVTPYVGAGIGLGHVSYEAPAAGLCGTGGCVERLPVSGGDGWRTNWSLMAGAAYGITERVLVDLGYRYTYSDDGDLLTASLPDGSSLALKDDGSERHMVTLGLRLRFD